MKNNLLKKIVSTVSIVLLFSMAGFSQITRDTFPGLPVVQQTGAPEWCWAAASKALCHYYNKSFSLSLADVAKIFTTDKNTCPPPAQLGSILKQIIEKNCPGIKAEFKTGPLPIADVKKELDAKRAYIYVIKWNASGYHCNSISGYKGGYDENGRSAFQVYAMDPGSSRKSWKTYTASGINQGQGSFGSLVITSPTGIGDQFQPVSQNMPFSIIASQQEPSMIHVSIAGLTTGAVAMKFYDMSGSCIARTEKLVSSHANTFSVPFSAGAGKYVVYCERVTDASVSTKGTFTIIK